MIAALPLTLSQALAFRLARHHLLEPADDPLIAARTLIGAQAQVHSAAILQLRARTRKTTARAIDRALRQDRSLVKLWGQRGTLHLTPADDLPMILALKRTFEESYRRWYRREGLTDAQIDLLVTAIAEAVAKRPMSRGDLAADLSPRLGEWARPWLEHSWGGAIKLATALGHVCHGPEREREATFISLNGWAPPAGPGDETPLLVLLRRYLAVYGPARPRDFAKFTNLPAPTVRALWEALHPELVPVEVEAKAGGRPLWALAEDEDVLREAAMPPGHITALPLFDPYLLAHHDTDPIVPGRHRAAVYRTAGWISAVILREGRLAAVWSHAKRGDGWRVTITPTGRFGQIPLRRATRRIRHLAGAYGIRDVTVELAAG